MPDRFPLHFDWLPATAARAQSDEPMRILLMGDFSGRQAAGDSQAIADRALLALDVDTFDSVMARLQPRLQLPVDAAPGTETTIIFTSLEDFHPDTLYQRLPLLQTLRQLREQLLDPATRSQAAAALGAAVETPSASATPAADAESDNDSIERLLGKKPASAAPDGAERLLRAVVEPYIVPQAVDVSAYVAAVDAAIGAHLRNILHHPAFQALEAAWRWAHKLATESADGETVKIYLLDVSRQALAADLHAAGDDVRRSGLYRLLTGQALALSEGRPWALLAGDYYFDDSPEDIALLAALGASAAAIGGPLLAGATPAIAGCDSLLTSPDPVDWQRDPQARQRWQALRTSPVAAWLGLALPRVLSRLPYGSKTDPVEHFDFEEMPAPEHANLLWGNPAFACAWLLADAFAEQGWAMQPGDRLDLDELPAYVHTDDGATALQPCAEIYLHERATQALLAQGLMPLLSYRNRACVRLARFQSLADPPRPLAGPWA